MLLWYCVKKRCFSNVAFLFIAFLIATLLSYTGSLLTQIKETVGMQVAKHFSGLYNQPAAIAVYKVRIGEPFLTFRLRHTFLTAYLQFKSKKW